MSSKGNTPDTSASSTQAPAPEPQVVSGWEYSRFAHNSERYAYIGKDDTTGEPEFVDYGPKGKR